MPRGRSRNRWSGSYDYRNSGTFDSYETRAPVNSFVDTILACAGIDPFRDDDSREYRRSRSYSDDSYDSYDSRRDRKQSRERRKSFKKEKKKRSKSKSKRKSKSKVTQEDSRDTEAADEKNNKGIDQNRDTAAVQNYPQSPPLNQRSNHSLNANPETMMQNPMMQHSVNNLEGTTYRNEMHSAQMHVSSRHLNDQAPMQPMQPMQPTHQTMPTPQVTIRPPSHIPTQPQFHPSEDPSRQLNPYPQMQPFDHHHVPMQVHVQDQMMYTQPIPSPLSRSISPVARSKHQNSSEKNRKGSNENHTNFSSQKNVHRDESRQNHSQPPIRPPMNMINMGQSGRTKHLQQQSTQGKESMLSMGGVSCQGRKNELDSRPRLTQYKSATDLVTSIQENPALKNIQLLNSELLENNDNLLETILPPGEAGLMISKTSEGLTIHHIADNSIAKDLEIGDIIVGLDGVDITVFSSKVVMQLFSRRKYQQRTLLYRKGSASLPGRTQVRSDSRGRGRKPRERSKSNRRSATPLKTRDLSRMRSNFLEKRESGKVSKGHHRRRT